jgi:hypothetical protein
MMMEYPKKVSMQIKNEFSSTQRRMRRGKDQEKEARGIIQLIVFIIYM